MALKNVNNADCFALLRPRNELRYSRSSVTLCAQVIRLYGCAIKGHLSLLQRT